VRPLSLDIVSSRGRLVHVEGLDEVVVRRRESGNHPGSEVAVLRGHAPLLMQVQPCVVRYSWSGGEREIEIGHGLLEVWESSVTIALT
jgi:F0F1-type ATP synthase epsilon subunit